MTKFTTTCLLALAFGFAGAASAHDVPNIEHTHAFKQSGYGTWRQGHSVNGPTGSITIWSARDYTGFQQAPSVRFARPEPITRAPASPVAKARSDRDPTVDYGKPNERD